MRPRDQEDFRISFTPESYYVGTGFYTLAGFIVVTAVTGLVSANIVTALVAGALSAWAAGSAYWFFTYLSACSLTNKKPAVVMPWKQPWTWVFGVMTLPWLPVWIASLVRYVPRRLKRQHVVLPVEPDSGAGRLLSEEGATFGEPVTDGIHYRVLLPRGWRVEPCSSGIYRGFVLDHEWEVRFRIVGASRDGRYFASLEPFTSLF